MVGVTGREGTFQWREVPEGDGQCDGRMVKGHWARKEWAKGWSGDKVRKVVRERQPLANRGLIAESDGKPGEGLKQRGNMTA